MNLSCVLFLFVSITSNVGVGHGFYHNYRHPSFHNLAKQKGRINREIASNSELCQEPCRWTSCVNSAWIQSAHGCSAGELLCANERPCAEENTRQYKCCSVPAGNTVPLRVASWIGTVLQRKNPRNKLEKSAKRIHKYKNEDKWLYKHEQPFWEYGK